MIKKQEFNNFGHNFSGPDFQGPQNEKTIWEIDDLQRSLSFYGP